MRANRKELEALASRIIEGDHVDWAEASRGVDEPSAVRALEQIDSLRRFSLRNHGSRTELVDQGSERWGPLEIRGLLGRGANGRVLRAWDPQLRHEVALKVCFRSDFDDAQRERLLNEGRRMVRVRHDNVVRIYGVLEHDGEFGLSMELVEGQTLAQRVAADGSWSEAEARAAGATLADALCALHDAGIVHQDVKAQNVMRETGGRLVLMDFGSGVELGSAEDLLPGGTPYYMAPELLVGGAPSRASDVYSLGVLLHFLVTGAFPYEGGSLRELREAHVQPRRMGLADRRPGLGSSFVAAVERALDPDPDRRFQTAGEFRQALSGATGSAAGAPAGSSSGKRVWAWIGAGVAACALVLWSVFAGMDRGFEVDAQVYRYDDASTRLELMSGATVEPGDRLALELELSEPLHIYVVNVDDQGEAWVLFPIAGVEQQNPVPPGTHELPGSREDGTRITWEVSSAGGREHLVVVAALRPVEAIEAALVDLPEAGSAYRRMDGTVLRGIGGLAEMPADPGTDPLETIDELIARPQQGRDYWVRRFTLYNR